MRLPWITNRADSVMNRGRVTIMAQLKFIGLFTLPHGGNRNQQGGMSLWCDLQPFVVVWRHFHVAGRNFEESSNTLKRKKKAHKRFSSSLNMMGGYWCVQNLPEWAWTFVSVLERQRAILEDGCHHTVVWQRYTVESWLFGLVSPTQFYASGNVCNLAPFLGQWQGVGLWA